MPSLPVFFSISTFFCISCFFSVSLFSGEGSKQSDVPPLGGRWNELSFKVASNSNNSTILSFYDFDHFPIGCWHNLLAQDYTYLILIF